MSEFKAFKIAVSKQFKKMCKGKLYSTGIDKDHMFETYLDSFPEGTNPIFREKQVHDCNCCRSFIRACGSVVSIVDEKLVSIWDIKVDNFYQEVADSMSELVKRQSINRLFLRSENELGTDFNFDAHDDRKWEHFYFKLPNKFVLDGESIGTITSKHQANHDVNFRGLSEISLESAKTILELIEQNSLYRGEEHKETVKKFIKLKKKFDKSKNKDLFCWELSQYLGTRNTVIGTLLVDLSDNMDLNNAVSRFESKVAPLNYKRPTALITSAMIEKAENEVNKLGISSVLQRRYATIDDITINNILYADRSTKKEMNVFSSLKKETPDKVSKLKKVQEVNIEDFISDIIPKAESIELLFENKHVGNLMSLIAPEDPDSKNILKWKNNFSWSYKGEVADSMKERVKKAGGRIDGVLRFSIQWNDGDNNQNDFDAHCTEPNENLICYANRYSNVSGGNLDVDIVTPGNKVAVENITWNNKNKMIAGKYKFQVHNFSHNGGTTGFTAEIEYDGTIYSYAYNKELRQSEKVLVAEIQFSKTKGIKFIKSLKSEESVREEYGINTSKFHKVKMIMNSPNHWDGNKTGNKHYFFILSDCLNPDTTRGFYNEFLNEKLTEHRKVFEVLGSKLKAPESDNQLSGLGFSSTQSNSVLCKVKGSFSRVIKIKF